MPMPNTDNKGKLLVTVFAGPCRQDRTLPLVHPDTRHYTQSRSCMGTVSRLRPGLYRDTAPVPIYQFSATETVYRPPINLVPRHA